MATVDSHLGRLTLPSLLPDGSNFNHWKRMVVLTFQIVGIVDALGDSALTSSSASSSTNAPASTADAAPAAPSNPARPAATTPALAAAEQEQRALLYLLSTLPTQLSMSISPTETAAGLWALLNKKFAKTGNQAQFGLLRQLFSVCMDPGQPVRAYFDHGRLVDAEWDRATKNSSLPADGAYVVQPGPSKPHSSTSTTSCRYCKAAGHAITTCPQLEKKKRRQQLQQQHQSPYLPQSAYQPQSQPYQPQQPQQMPFRSFSQNSPNKAAAHTALPPLAYPAHLAQPLLPSPTSDATSPALAASHLSSTPLSSSIDSRYADVAAAHLLPTSWLPSLPSLLLLISFLLCLFSILLQRPLASVLTSSPSSSSWLLDSGASSHLCNDPHLFSSLRQPFPGSGVRFGGGEQYPAHGIGDILVYARHNNHTHPITLKDVLYVP
ncbi:unnamed protein product [Closterium sp. NIES-65]|nr:unnamed protein product [Closterium sp. NIES-65]